MLAMVFFASSMSPCLFLSLPRLSHGLSLSLSLSPASIYSQIFISDIRAANNKEAEQTRVEKELAKIRKKFATGTAVTGEFDGFPLSFFSSLRSCSLFRSLLLLRMGS